MRLRRIGHRLIAGTPEDMAGTVFGAIVVLAVITAGSTRGTLEPFRLALVAATRQVLANGLAVLGVSAPERM